MKQVLVVLLAVGLLGGCGRAQGVADTRRALERTGYRYVDVSLRTGGGIGVARIEAAAGTLGAGPAAEVAWNTLPVRFDQLIVALGSETEAFNYQELADRFGPRDRSLDGRQVDEEVIESGVKLMLLLSAGALLSVGAVVAIALVALRAGGRARLMTPADGRGRGARQAEGPTSGLGAASLTAEVPAESEGDEAIPS